MKNSKEQILEFLYQETEIHFLVNPKEKNVMVNATEMAKIFGKRVEDFTRLNGTENFITSVINLKNSKNKHAHLREYFTRDNMIVTSKRGGTLMHRQLAIKFAGWLDSDFEAWVNSIVDELLFSKNENVAKAFEEENNLLVERKRIIEEAIAKNNKQVLELLEVEDKLGKTKYQKDKAIKEFKSQYKIQF